MQGTADGVQWCNVIIFSAALCESNTIWRYAIHINRMQTQNGLLFIFPFFCLIVVVIMQLMLFPIEICTPRCNLMLHSQFYEYTLRSLCCHSFFTGAKTGEKKQTDAMMMI